jgi:hypothetical protein
MHISIEIVFEAEVYKVREILSIGVSNGWTSSILPGIEHGLCVVTWSAPRLAPHEAELMMQEATRLHRNTFEEGKMKSV